MEDENNFLKETVKLMGSKIDNLEKRNQKLEKGLIEYTVKSIESIDSIFEMAKLRDKYRKLKECVEFYADKEKWNISDIGGANSVINASDLYNDGQVWGGYRARKCLKELENYDD